VVADIGQHRPQFPETFGADDVRDLCVQLVGGSVAFIVILGIIVALTQGIVVKA
jgi:hypothetical protein